MDDKRNVLHYEGTPRELLQFYLPFFSNCKKVLDYGCGRGDFLQLCREHGIAAEGVDANPAAVEICRNRGLVCHPALPIGKLAEYDGLFLCCVVEHMTGTFLRELLSSFTGFLCIHADEPRRTSILWQLRKDSFWDDFEHVRPYTPVALRKLLTAHGFTVVGAGVAPQRPVGIRHLRTWLTQRYEALLYRLTGIDGSHYCCGIKHAQRGFNQGASD